MTYLKDSLKIVTLALLSLFAYQGYCVLVAVEARVEQASQTIENAEATLRTANRVLLSVGGTAAVLRDAAKTARDTSAKQAILLEDTHKKLNATLSNFDARLNEEFMPAATAAIRHADENSTVAIRDIAFSIRKVNDEVDELNEEIKPLLRSLTRTTDGMAALTNDPAIPATLKSVEGSAKNIEVTTGHIAKATKPAKLWLTGLTWTWTQIKEQVVGWWAK